MAKDSPKTPKVNFILAVLFCKNATATCSFFALITDLSPDFRMAVQVLIYTLFLWQSRSATNPSVGVWAVQCEKCLKWRRIATQEQFEDIRSRFTEEPFNCPNGTCDDPADIEYDASRTWAIDKPNLPKTPSGFKRELYLRRDYSKMDTYYFTPLGKKLRSVTDVTTFLEQNPQLSDVKPSDFSFTSPKVMDDTIPSTALLANSHKKGVASSTKWLDGWSWTCSYA